MLSLSLRNVRDFLHAHRNAVVRVALMLPLALLIAMAWIFLVEDRALRSSLDWIEHSYQVRAELDHLRILLADLEVGQRVYFQTRNADWLQAGVGTRRQIDEAMAALKRLYGDDARLQAELRRLQQLVDDRLATNDQIVSLIQQGHDLEALENLRPAANRGTMAKLRAAVADLQTTEQKNLLALKQSSISRNARLEWVVGGLVAASLLVVAVLVYLLHWVYQLQRLVVMCAWTRQVQVDGQWVGFEEYLDRTFGLKVTHGISAEATKQVLNDLQERLKAGKL